MIIRELQFNGVIVNAEFADSLPDSGFSAHVENGETYSAVSSIAVEQYEFSETFIRRQLSGADWVSLEANLSQGSMERILCIARELGIRSSLQLVSEEKSLKLTQIPAPEFAIGNQREHQYLMAHTKDWEPPASLVFIVTNGAKRTSAYRGDALAMSVYPTYVEDIVNKLGAGDAFAAGAILAACQALSMPLEEIIDHGHKMAGLVLKLSNCNLGSHEVLNRALADLNNRAVRDQLTGLYNRQGEEKVFAEIEHSGEPYAIIFLDVDHFKSVNDNYGHPVGDKALAFVADILKNAVRDSDHVIRHGGEEFIVLLPGAFPERAMEVAERLVAAIRDARPPHPLEHLTISAGVACSDHGTGIHIVADQADKALYRAKQSGRDRAYYYEKVSASVAGDMPVLTNA